MKYKYLFAALVLGCTLMAGCEKDNLYENIPEGAILLNTEGFQSNDKTSVSDESVQWVGGESVTINGTPYSVIVSDGHAYVSGSAIASGTRVYGYYACASVSRNDDGDPLTDTVNVPSSYSCSYDANGRQVIALPMVAYDGGASETRTLEFRHVTAAVKVRVKNTTGSTIKVERVTVSSSSYALSGSTPVTLADGAAPSVGDAAGSGSVSVVISSGLSISNDSIGEVQVPIRPVGAGNLTVVISARLGNQTYDYSNTITISSALGRNQMLSAGCHVQTSGDYIYNPNSEPLTFEAMTNNATVTLTKYGSAPYVSIQYSTDGGSNWSTYRVDTTGAITLTNVGDKVQFRATSNNPTHTSMASSPYNYNYFTLTGNCYVYGNVMSLLKQTFEAETTLNTTVTFAKLFDNCSTLYSHPTKELVLPATELTNWCYASMFSGCTNLTRAPALPATQLAISCYNQMFYNCTSLTTAPALPATTLISKCYYYMFNGCSNLTMAPVLPATTLASYCYAYMFQGCSNLNYIKCLATSGINSGGSTTDWVVGVSSTGTFVNTTGTDASPWGRGTSLIPTGWTVQASN